MYFGVLVRQSLLTRHIYIHTSISLYFITCLLTFSLWQTLSRRDTPYIIGDLIQVLLGFGVHLARFICVTNAFTSRVRATTEALLQTSSNIFAHSFRQPKSLVCHHGCVCRDEAWDFLRTATHRVVAAHRSKVGF